MQPLKTYLTLPNMLTFFRVLVIPTFVLAFYMGTPLAKWLMFLLFVAAGVTDYFDGYLARKFNQISELGKLLDPIADKILVACILVMMIDTDQLKAWTLIPTLVILSREIMVSGLREFLASIRVKMPVTLLAKWKTAAQMVALGTLLFGYAVESEAWINHLGKLLLWIAAILTLMTGYAYLRQGMKHIKS